MKYTPFVFIFFLIHFSCNENSSLKEDFPIIYLGSDTTYNQQPIENYCIHISQLSLTNKDTSILKLQSIPVAPIDSPYRIHGSTISYYGKIIAQTHNKIKIKWSEKIDSDFLCTQHQSNNLLLNNKNITIIDISKDTLCIGDIESIKQK